MGTVALRLSDAHLALGHGRRRRAVLAGIDLTVDHGESVAIVGPSGSGKSTLLSVLAGLTALDRGTLDLGNERGHFPGIVFQHPHLLPWATVSDNVALGLRFARQRAGRRQRRQATAEILDRLGIAELANRLPAELSGGQAQRVAIARTMITEPSVVLLDEPFGSLDPRTRRDLQDWLGVLRRQLDLTVVLVTHDIDEALLLGDRVGVLVGSGQPLSFVASDVAARPCLTSTAARPRLLAHLGVDASERLLVG